MKATANKGNGSVYVIPTEERGSVSMDGQARNDILPKPLKKGSKIAIAAPARIMTREEMQYAVDWLKAQGFVAVYDDRLFAEHYIFAGDDDFRAAVLQEWIRMKSMPFGCRAAAMAASALSTNWISRSSWSIPNGSSASATRRCFTAS